MVLSPAHPDAGVFDREAASSARMIAWFSELGAVFIPTVGFFIRSQAFFPPSSMEQSFPSLSRGSKTLLNLGLTDALRASSDDGGLYTFWDYQAGAYQRDDGIRIDHLLLSPQAADRLTSAGIDRDLRGWDKPSDHVPVYVDLEIAGR